MRRKFIIGGVILCLAIGYLFYVVFDLLDYYVPISELLEQGSARYGETIRVKGNVVEGSVDWNPKELELKFIIADGDNNLPVMYEGAIPNAFTAGKEIVAEGRYNPDGIFHASNLLLRCPSKYASQD